MSSPSITSSSSSSSQSSYAKIPKQVASVAGEKLSQAKEHFVLEPASDLFSTLKDYAHRKPDVAALWCLGLGIVIGWKLRR